MPKYKYEAISETGATVTGTLEADSAEAAENILGTRGLIPSRVAVHKASGSQGSYFRNMFGKVPLPDLILFTKQFRTLIKAGVPMITLLQVLENQSENPKLKVIIGTMIQDVREGITLSDAFRKHPRVFSNLYCSILQAGESSGAIPEVLDRLAYIISHEHKIKTDMKSALQYPKLVTITLAVAFFVLLTFVVPKFAATFKNAGLDLPIPTVICMKLYDFIANYWYIGIGVVVAVMAGWSYFLKTEAGRYSRDAFVLRVPIFGELFIKAAMSRFSSIFSILQMSGVPVLDSLRVLSGTIGNVAIAREFDKIRDRVEEGRGIAGPLGAAQYFTPMVVNMVAIGEESGSIHEMLKEVSVHYDDEVAYAIGRLAGAIGPIMIIGLAAVVGFFALAIFLPMWDLTKMVNH